MGLDRVDMLLIHDVNRKYHGERVMEMLDTALAGTCKALVRLRDEGVIGAFGPALKFWHALQRGNLLLDAAAVPQ